MSVKAHLCSTLNPDGAFCPCSVFISSVFLHVSIKLTDTDQTEQYHRKPWGGSVAVTTRYVALVRHEEEITMAELFEERLCELVRNFKHIVFVFYARGTLSISPPQSPCLILSLLLSQTFDSVLPPGGCIG